MFQSVLRPDRGWRAAIERLLLTVVGKDGAFRDFSALEPTWAGTGGALCVFLLQPWPESENSVTWSINVSVLLVLHSTLVGR